MRVYISIHVSAYGQTTMNNVFIIFDLHLLEHPLINSRKLILHYPFKMYSFIHIIIQKDNYQILEIGIAVENIYDEIIG